MVMVLPMMAISRALDTASGNLDGRGAGSAALWGCSDSLLLRLSNMDMTVPLTRPPGVPYKLSPDSSPCRCGARRAWYSPVQRRRERVHVGPDRLRDARLCDRRPGGRGHPEPPGADERLERGHGGGAE